MLVIYFILFLLLLSFCSSVDEELVMNRVRVMKNDAKQDSIRIHGSSSDLATFHAILRFSSPINTYHNTLFIDQSSMHKYEKIIQDEREELVIQSRDIRKVMSFHTVQDNATNQDTNDDGYNDKLYELVQSVRYLGLGGSTGITYDGVLLLDEYSAIWNEYNIAIFTENLLTFRYVGDGSLSEFNDPEVVNYDGLIELPCDLTFNSDQCLVDFNEGITVLATHYFPTYRVLIDLDSPRNFLPIDLYLLWYSTDEIAQLSTLVIDFTNGSDTNDRHTLYLNRQEFEYEMHQSNIILLGVDVLHNFPRLEYSVTNRVFQLWYYKGLLLKHNNHEVIKLVFMFFNLGLIVTLFVWATSYNYMILDYMIRFSSVAKVTHYFAHKQIIFEVMAMILSLIVIIISLSVPQTGESIYHLRKTLLIGFLSYYLLFMLGILLYYRTATYHAFKHYFPRPYRCILYCFNRALYRRVTTVVYRELVTIVATTEEEGKTLCVKDGGGGGCSNSDLIERRCISEVVVLPYAELFLDICDRKIAEKLHTEVVGLYHDPLIRLPTPVVIVHNASFIGCILLGIALLFNFYTPLNIIYLLLILVFSFALIYYQVKYIAISVFYLSLFYGCCRISRCDKFRNHLLILFILIQSVVVFLYILFSYERVYIAYFNSVNSTHSLDAIRTYLNIIIAFVILAPIFVVYAGFVKYANPLIACAIDYKRKLKYA